MHFTFDEAYFKEEVRDGFTVTEAMKRYWAATLRTLEVFDGVCRAHGLSYFADWGTLLGAYRHGGFVPWDDDLDVGMRRKDFDRFLEIAGEALPEGYAVETFDSPYHRYSGISVVVNHHGADFSPALLETYCLCPFSAGFDLYLYDNSPADPEERQRWRLEGMRYLVAMELLRKKGVEDPETKKALRELGVKDAAPEDRDRLLITFGKAVDRISARYQDEETEMVVQYGYLIRDNYEPYLRRAWFESFTTLPFETAEIPCPEHTEDILRCFYGLEFMTPRQGTAAHEYPIYRRDLTAMISFLEKGGMRLSELPPMLSYLKKEADMLGIPYQK